MNKRERRDGVDALNGIYIAGLFGIIRRFAELPDLWILYDVLKEAQ